MNARREAPGHRLPVARGRVPRRHAVRASETDVRSCAGRYSSDEAETILTVALDGADLVIKRRPDTTLPMRAVEKDVFAVPTLGQVTFRRGPDGRVTELSVKLDRVWDLRFNRVP